MRSFNIGVKTFNADEVAKLASQLSKLTKASLSRNAKPIAMLTSLACDVLVRFAKELRKPAEETIIDLMEAAWAWQSQHDRDLDELYEKLVEETDEWRHSRDHLDMLSEISDVVVTVFRILHRLGDNERRFVARYARMKVHSRTVDPGQKNWKIELAKAREIAKEFGLMQKSDE